MPELPEVETVVRTLQPWLLGQTVVQVSVAWPKLIVKPDLAAFLAALPGRTLGPISRRGKYILIETLAPTSSPDAGKLTLIVHLRMTGNLLVGDESAADELIAEGRGAEPLADAHVHLRIRLASGRTLCYRDVRKFGRFWLVADPALVVGDLGPEPLDPALTLAQFSQRLRSYRRQLKPALLDQHVIAGLGNIYVDETLWRAALHPLRRTDSLREDESARLFGAMRAVLAQAVADGGTTLRDYRNPENEPGRHQLALAVYHRHGQACPRCGAEIERLLVGQRGTHICPICQTRGA